MKVQKNSLPSVNQKMGAAKMSFDRLPKEQIYQDLLANVPNKQTLLILSCKVNQMPLANNQISSPFQLYTGKGQHSSS